MRFSAMAGSGLSSSSCSSLAIFSSRGLNKYKSRLQTLHTKAWSSMSLTQQGQSMVEALLFDFKGHGAVGFSARTVFNGDAQDMLARWHLSLFKVDALSCDGRLNARG